MSLTPRDIETIAHLARLSLKPEEIPVYTDSLGRILDLVGQLEQADTASVVPMAHPLEGQVQRLREDCVTSPNERDRVQANAPQVEAGLYLVPRVIE
jgi:aspartyl-tRNA(Asn)/glutamyl-tRNA(Gln) amidotransferase subunit C